MTTVQATAAVTVPLEHERRELHRHTWVPPAPAMAEVLERT